jgi:translation elongation factor EF-Tu-like GTPase
MIWPHPEELFVSGSKIHGYETLRVASLSIGTPTPLFVMAGDLVEDVHFLKNLENGIISGVLKRDYSMKGEHVITPSTVGSVEKIKKSKNEVERTWKTVEKMFGVPHWFIQPFVAHLVHVGEVRAFVVEGRLVYKVTTTPREDGSLSVNDEENIRPLHTHR